MRMMTVGIVGFGRFARFWASQLIGNFVISVYDVDRTHSEGAASEAGFEFQSLEDLCKTCKCLFICVPINQFQAIVQEMEPHLRIGTTVIDVCSVKEHSERIMKDHLSATGVEMIATHPLFGPDSGKNGVAGLRLVMWPVTAESETYRFWRSYFRSLELMVVEISPAEHDYLAAYSQGVAHFISRVLQRMDLHATDIDTVGFRILLGLIDQTCNDSEELFRDLQTYNRFAAGMRGDLAEAVRSVDNELAALRADHPSTTLRIGIQGGPGSFNELACRQLCDSAGYAKYEVVFLMRTGPVLEWLSAGRIDRGVFALYNTRAGIVRETLEALTQYPCEILETTELTIRHCLAAHPDAELSQLDTVVSHEQVLLQCASSLTLGFPKFRRVATDSQAFRDIAASEFSLDLVDQATCARYLAQGRLPRNIALVVPRISAEMFGLRVYQEDLQDAGEENRTVFAWARRRSKATEVRSARPETSSSSASGLGDV